MNSRMVARAIVIILVFVIFGTLFSIHFNDAHFMNRFGAALSAFGAVLVVWQVKQESVFDGDLKNTERLLDSETDKPEMRELSPAKRKLVTRIIGQSIAGAHEDRNKKRMEIAVFITVLIISGEIIHGFGDLMFKYLSSLLSKIG